MSTQEIDAAILDEAAAWMVRLNGSDAALADQAALSLWCEQSPQHAQAWKRAERLLGKMHGLPSALAKPVLDRNHNAMRRQLLGKVALFAAMAPTAWTAWRLVPSWSADFRTATGEQRILQLADGSAVHLNTATAFDVRFDHQQRMLHLIVGEILIDTARDAQLPPRPFLVESAEGRMRAIGTRFSVQQMDGATRLTVLQGAVEIRPRNATTQSLILSAGESSTFTRDRIEAAISASENDVAWSRGMLIADAMPLSQLVAELSRYRPGVLRCDPDVSNLPVSGAFPIDNIERSLSMLQTTYPLQVRYVTRYWVNLASR